MGVTVKLADVRRVMSAFENKDEQDLRDAIVDELAKASFLQTSQPEGQVQCAGPSMAFLMFNTDIDNGIASKISRKGGVVHPIKKGTLRRRRLNRKEKIIIWQRDVEPVLEKARGELCKAAHPLWVEYVQHGSPVKLVRDLAVAIAALNLLFPPWLLAAASFLAYYLVRFSLPKYCEWKHVS